MKVRYGGTGETTKKFLNKYVASQAAARLCKGSKKKFLKFSETRSTENYEKKV